MAPRGRCSAARAAGDGEKDPFERRKFANALLKARPVKTVSEADDRERRAKEHADRASDNAPPKYGPGHVPAAIAHLSGLLAMLNRDKDDEDKLDDAIDDEIDEPMVESS